MTVEASSTLLNGEFCSFTLYNELDSVTNFRFTKTDGNRVYMKLIGEEQYLSWVRAEDWDLKVDYVAVETGVDYDLDDMMGAAFIVVNTRTGVTSFPQTVTFSYDVREKADSNAYTIAVSMVGMIMVALTMFVL